MHISALHKIDKILLFCPSQVSLVAKHDRYQQRWTHIGMKNDFTPVASFISLLGWLLTSPPTTHSLSSYLATQRGKEKGDNVKGCLEISS